MKRVDQAADRINDSAASAPGVWEVLKASALNRLGRPLLLTYLALLAFGVLVSRLPQLVAIGKDLQAALTMAAASKSGTRRHRQAWELAEVATHRLGSLLDAYVGVKPLVTSAFSAVDESAEPSERESRRLARQRR